LLRRERVTRLELATSTLARSVSESFFRGKQPLKSSKLPQNSQR
jgi:hypothetical protein